MNLIENILADIYEQYRAKRNGGKLADYIPQLALVNPHNFGMVVTTVDGHQYAFGDTEVNFTIQSVSKPFVYGMAIQEHGVAKVLDKISVEPSGDSFNSISLYPDSGRPFNPMINAGAIAATNLVWQVYGEKTFDKILEVFCIYADAQLGMDESIFQSENETGHRNRAIAHLLRNFNILESEVIPPLETYFRQCSINVTCRQLSVMGATLANNGVNPRSGKKALDKEYVPKVLSVMSTCGMYDYSGTWIYEVGLPAKSGVGGGVLAVLPGQLSIAVYSPLLDAKGNSVYGVEVCKTIADSFSLHLYKTPTLYQQIIRKHLTLETARSKFKRDQAAENILQRHGRNVHLMELQGELGFASCEVFIRRIGPECKTLILNLGKCQTADDAAFALLLKLYDHFQKTGRSLFITNYAHLEIFAGLHKPHCDCLRFSEQEAALSFCEDTLLRQNGYEYKKEPVLIKDQELLQELNGEELTELQKHLRRHQFSAGDTIIHRDSKAEYLYFLESGRVAIVSTTDKEKEFTLARLFAGNSFGEMSLLDKKPRSASVKAETDVSCYFMPFELLEQDPELAGVKTKILKNLAAALSARLRIANQEIAGFV